MTKEKRVLSQKDASNIRESVREGVERVVKPFVKRIEAQSKVQINGNIRIR